MDRARTVSKLVRNALRYRLLKFTGRPGRLEAISLEITHRCICRCRMCNIWKIPQEVSDLPLSDWTNLLSSAEFRGLKELDITGGEPFLREDLVDLLKWICRSQPASFPGLRTVAITTNGLLTDRILEIVGKIAVPFRERGIDLVLACGMDAIGEVHDQIRNVNGAWKRLNSTIIGLKELREKHPNLILGIKTTIVPANVHELLRISSFASEQGLFTIISPCIITSNRFGNTALKDDLQFSPEGLQAISRFYASPLFAWDIHRQSMIRYLKTGEANKPCSAGFNTAFVRHTGEVFPCPLIPAALGNIKKSNIKQLLSGLPATRFRKWIGNYPECKVCTEPGLERIAWPYEGFACLRRLLRMGFNDLEQLKRHMGLDKYM